MKSYNKEIDRKIMQGHFAEAFGATWQTDAVFDAKTLISPTKHLCVPCVEHNEKHPHEYMHEKATPGHPVMDFQTDVITFHPKDIISTFGCTKEHCKVHPVKRQWGFLSRLRQQPSRVAIVVPHRDHGIDQLVLGFLDTLSGEGVIPISDIYNAEGNNTFLFHHIVPEIIGRDYDLVYTVGHQCTFLVSHLFSNQSRKIPHIFVGVGELDRFGLDLRTQAHVTGVRANANLALRVASLLAVKPDLKNVGLLSNPYDCGGATAGMQKEVIRIFQDYDVLVKPLNITRKEQIQAAAQELAQTTQVLMTLPGNTMDSVILELSDICDTHRKPLYVSDLSGVAQGAVISCGYLAYPTGVLAGEKAVAILRDRKPVYDMSISETAEQFRFLVNEDARFKQGLYLDQHRLVMLEHGSMAQRKG